MKKALILVLVLMVFATGSYAQRNKKKQSKGLEPTKANIEYGKHERNKLDFWKAESDKPTPLVVFFHGGGFKGGDKAIIHRMMSVKDYLSRGVSCASVNYPFLVHTDNNYIAIMKECANAMEFIVKKAGEWNVDKKRIAVSGSSAGTLISEWLGCTTAHISVMGVYAQPKGTDLLVLPFLKKGSPPIVIYQASPASDNVHNPKYAQMLKDACDKKGVECALWGTGSNGITKLPAGKDARKVMMEFFFKTWRMKVDKDGNKDDKRPR